MDFSTVSSTWTSTYNALAYSSKNNLIYGVTQRTSSGLAADENQLVVIDSAGTVTSLGNLQINPAYASTNISYGTVSGIVGGRVTSVSTYGQAWNNDIYGGINFGFFDAAGNYWIGNASTSGSGVMYQVDLTTGYVTPLTNQSAAIRSNDLTFAFGYAWGIVNQSQTMIRINLSTGQIDSFSIASAGMPSGTYGAAWTYGNGNLGFDINSGGVYQVQVINPGSSKPSFKLVATSAGPASGNNDGTACASQPADISIVKTGPSASVAAGGTTTWDLAVTNNGPGVSSGFTVTDPMPTNFTYKSSTWTGGTCTVDTSSNIMTCVSSDVIPAGTTTHITITATAGTADACYSNSTSVLGNEADPYQANNTSSVQTCVGSGTKATCDSVMYGSFGNSASAIPTTGSTAIDGASSSTTVAAQAPAAYDLSIHDWMVPRLTVAGGGLFVILCMCLGWAQSDRRERRRAQTAQTKKDNS